MRMTIQCICMHIDGRFTNKCQSGLFEKANQIDKYMSSVMAKKKKLKHISPPKCSGAKQFYRQIFSNFPGKMIFMLCKPFSEFRKKGKLLTSLYEVRITLISKPSNKGNICTQICSPVSLMNIIILKRKILNKTLAIQFSFKRIKHCAHIKSISRMQRG